MKFDLIVIGAGSGLEVSSAAAERGLSVAVVESGPFGGTCLNRGCIPSKMLIHCADVVETINTASKLGVKARVEAIDWRFIINRAFDTIDRDAANVERANREAPNITVFKGEAVFTGRKTLRVDADEISSDTIVIAAGARPFVPDIPGLESVRFLTSDQALRLSEQPRRMAILEIESAGGTRTLTVDALLVATGRIPNTDTLNVAAMRSSRRRR